MISRVVLCALLPLLLVSCVSPDLGDAPFQCNRGRPPCPDGYECDKSMGANGVCVRQGSKYVQPSQDAAPPPADGPAPRPDGTAPQPDKSVPPTTRTIVITELMANPKVVTDGKGEYLELFNVTDAPIDIDGWTLKDNGSDSHTIAAGGPLVVPPRGFIVLGANTDKLDNGGVAVAYAYTSFYLANSDDEVQILDGQGKIVDQFAYSRSSGWTIPEGASLSAPNPLLDKSDFANWCPETNMWPGSLGDRGTPGASPGCK